MRKYDKKAIMAAFSQVARWERESSPVVLTKITGLNARSRDLFKKAVTHNFNVKEHGFTLQQIFEVGEGKIWKRKSTPCNPKDDSLIDRIIQAMTFIGLNEKANREIKNNTFSSITLADEVLISELQNRGYIVSRPL